MAHSTQIFAHRGVWGRQGPKGNSMQSLSEALQYGFSVETDIRDFLGEIVISHDPPNTSTESLNLYSLLEIARLRGQADAKLALNVKADGLTLGLESMVAKFDHVRGNAYFFDMSIPETLRYSKANLPFAVRVSEYEPVTTIQEIRWPSKPVATWVDGFHGEWFLDDGGEWLLRRTEQGLVTIVSPELHARDSSRVMDWFLENASEYPNLTICTDLPWEYLDA